MKTETIRHMRATIKSIVVNISSFKDEDVVIKYNELYGKEGPIIGIDQNGKKVAFWLSYAIHDDDNVKGFFGKYRYLSNFHVSPVYFDGMFYPSSENAYQAAKCHDPEKRKDFVNLSPSESKKLGRTVAVRTDWEKVKYDVMSSVVFDKFYRNEALRARLLETRDKYLEETNHWKDQTWGVCDGNGLNWLGQILMATREFWKAKSKGKSIELF